jgi:hypothetical protein
VVEVLDKVLLQFLVLLAVPSGVAVLVAEVEKLHQLAIEAVVVPFLVVAVAVVVDQLFLAFIDEVLVVGHLPILAINV